MRSFVALDLPEPLVGPLLQLQGHLTTGRPVPEENLHLTLAYLGDQPESRLEELHHRLEGLVLRMAPPVIRLTGLQTFGGTAAPRLVAAGVAPDAALSRLQRAVRTAAESADIDLRRERFRPHVTLVRFGNGIAPEAAPKLGRFLAGQGDFAAGPEPAASMSLCRSHLGPDGAEYEALARYLLCGP